MPQRRLPPSPSSVNSMQKLVLAASLMAIFFMSPNCSSLNEQQIQIPALKRISQLGYLYNQRTDTIINVNVFGRKIPTEHITQTQIPDERTTAAITNSLEKQFKLFGIDDNTAVNILTGTTIPRGAASSLTENSMKPSEFRGTLLLKYETDVQRLEAFDEGLKGFYNKDVLRHLEATHLVTSITWGTRVAVTLDASLMMETREIQKIQKTLNTALRNLRGKLSPADEIESNFSMSISSDIPLQVEFPTTAKEVKEILNQVPTLISGVNEGKGIPLHYTLTPINMIRSHMDVSRQKTTVQEIDEFTLSEIVDSFQDLYSAEDRINKIKNKLAGHANCFSSQTETSIKELFSNFRNFKLNFTTTLKKLVTEVRSGLQKDQVLSDSLEDSKKSEFHLENLNHQFLNFASIVEKIDLCNAIQNEYRDIQYFGAGDNLIQKLTSLQKSETSVFIMFTNSEFIRNQPETYTQTFNLLLEKLEVETNTCLFVDCDFTIPFCSQLNDTRLFEYADGNLNPSGLKRAAVENFKILALEENFVDMQRNLSYLQNFTNILEHKLVCGFNPCLNGGMCSFKNNERHCECSAGFLGDNCETNIDDCAGHNRCQNGGTCVDGANIFSCVCAQGFTGDHCETNIDDCAGHNHCQNGGTCVDSANIFSCVCAQGFTGDHCETNIDDCAGHNRCQNGGTCVDGANRFNCVCTQEFIGDYCEHRDECVYPGTCTSVSIDAKCKCREGYVLDPVDSRKCKFENENATLIFGSSQGIEQFSLSQQSTVRIQNYTSDERALDVMYRTNTMFWGGSDGTMYTAPIREGAPKTVVLSESGSYVLCLAVDWIYNHVYYADFNKNKLCVTNLDGTMTKVFFTTGITGTHAIVVNPLSGWIYWANNHAKNIERAGLDGSKREVIANTSPNSLLGLALDMTQNRLYWTTVVSHPCSIHSMNPDGSDLKLVYRATQPTFSSSRFYHITIFGDDVYWRDYSTKAVYKTNKCGGGEATRIYTYANSGDSYNTIEAFHFSKQPEGVNYCENRIGGQCSHLCFPTSSTGNGNQSVATKCACPGGLTLSSNQLTCT